MSTTTIAPQHTAQHSIGHTPSYRLTRRGRLVVLVLGLLVVLALGFALAGGSVATEESGPPVETETVLVAPGDTLWDIASEAAAATGEGDVRAMVVRIQRLNAMDTVLVDAGQQLRVPAVG